MFVPSTPDVLTQAQIIHWLKGVFGGVTAFAVVILSIMELIILRKGKSSPQTPPPNASEIVVNREATSTPK